MRFSERVRAHLRGNLVAYVALFFALNAGAYAVSVAPKNSVTSKSIKNRGVKNKDLANGAVDAQKVANNSLGGSDIDESSLGQVLKGSDPIPGGDLSGTYAAPQLRNGSVGAAELASLPSASLVDPISNVDVTAECEGTNSTFPNNTYQNIQFASVMFDSAGLASQPNPPNQCFNRFVVPVAGTYLATASVGWAPDADGSRKIALFAAPPSSSDFALHASSQGPASGGGQDTRQSAAGIARLDAGDHVWLQGFQDSGAGLGFTNSAESGMQVAWIGP